MKSRCPDCAEQGKDTSGNGLHTYPDGSTYCFKCGTHTRADSKREPVSKLTVPQVNTYPVKSDPTRELSHSTVEKYNVRGSVNTSTGEVDHLYYPYTEDGVLAGYKVRELPKNFKPSVGKIGKELFGKVQAEGKDFLLITEGEEDCLAAYEMISKRKPMPSVDVVSLPNGAKSKLHDEADFIAKYKRVYLCFDNDDPGEKASAEIGDWISTITECRIMHWPDDVQDASHALTLGKTHDFFTAIRSANVHEPEGVVNGKDIALDDLLVPMPEGIPIPFTGLQEKLHGLRKGEIMTVCAGSGIGKSTMVREIALSLIEQGHSIANVALEDQINVAAQALMALDMNIPLPIFRMRPPDKSECQTSYDKIIANGNTYFYKHFAGITANSLMDKLYYYARSKKVDFIILDHLSLVISASESTNERKDIDMLMTKLAKMVVETGVGLIQIVHLKRSGGDKSFAKGGEVELTDLRGSAALEQLSWSVVGLERDQQGDDRDFSKIRVLKNRTWGFTGICDTVKFDPTTGRMASVILDDGATEEELDDEESIAA